MSQPGPGSEGGVLCDNQGRVFALWGAYLSQKKPTTVEQFFRGLPVNRVLDVVTPMRNGASPHLRSLGVELVCKTLVHVYLSPV